MDKVFNHKLLEQNIYRVWEDSGAFTPKNNRSNKARRAGDPQGMRPFTIIMPPPNASDPLHIGHSREASTQDILIRYHRMKGDITLWLPGADHAGIETQFVFEKKLKEKGHSRFDYDRDTLYKMIWEYVEKNMGVMKAQLKALGASCDWTRFKFTLDPDIVKIVYKTFKKLDDDGLLYRGKRIVNYCPRCGTNFSDLEVDTKEQEGVLYYLDYGTITIATTRPETIFADVAVAVNPTDKKYKNLVGKQAIVPLVNREVPIIADRDVDIGYGTGALKITPGHDPVDFAIGERHKLSVVSVLDENGRMINCPEAYVGLSVKAAREKVVEGLRAAGKLIKEKSVNQIIGICYRDKGPIEPTVSEQWFLKVAPLVKPALTAIKNKEVKFPADQYRKIAVHWLKNLHDWNISRQIVWGMRIPAWKCDKCLKWTITNGAVPKECSQCGHNKLKQDEDTFDTWFSSGQWPYATLQSVEEGDFEYFYPTTVMDPSYDILAFWVIRMIMLGIYTTGKVPFTDVLLHGLVRDKFGIKISKSKGNVIDPMEMVDKYGADALRMAIIWGTRVEKDNALSEENIRGQRNFANKIWNVSRFVFMEEPSSPGGYKIAPRTTNENDRRILKELRETTKKATKFLDKYQLNEAAEELYDFFWNKFANTYLEQTKERRSGTQPTLEFVLQQSLKLIHPFMPFVTEAIWQESGKRFDSKLLISAIWPK